MSMSILVQTRSEQEEKAVLDFLDSLDIEYQTEFENDEQIPESFIKKYNEALDKADLEIEKGNFLDQNDVEAFFDQRRRTI